MRWRFVLVCALASVVSVVACKPQGTRLESIEPPFGSMAGNDDVVIVGSGFQPGLTVHFSKRAAHKVVIESEQRIRLKTPPGPEGKVDVVVTDDAGRTYVLEKAFVYRKES